MSDNSLQTSKADVFNFLLQVLLQHSPAVARAAHLATMQQHPHQHSPASKHQQ
jgi:hypothetical protein